MQAHFAHRIGARTATATVYFVKIRKFVAGWSAIFRFYSFHVDGAIQRWCKSLIEFYSILFFFRKSNALTVTVATHVSRKYLEKINFAKNTTDKIECKTSLKSHNRSWFARAPNDASTLNSDGKHTCWRSCARHKYYHSLFWFLFCFVAGYAALRVCAMVRERVCVPSLHTHTFSTWLRTVWDLYNWVCRIFRSFLGAFVWTVESRRCSGRRPPCFQRKVSEF